MEDRAGLVSAPGRGYVIIPECLPAPIDRGLVHDPRVMIGNRLVS
jgi:hypothetical protein